MNHLFVTANHYYAVLERFGYQYLMRSPWPWVWTLFLLAFIWQAVSFFLSETEVQGMALFLNGHFLLLIALEFIVIYLSNKLGSEKTRIVLERINSKYRQSFSNIEQARRFLLKRYFGRPESEYLSFVEDIQKAISYQDQLRNPLAFGLSQVLSFLYDPDSKQRIYALLLVIVTILTTLSIREGGSISSVFEFFAEENTVLIIFVWLLLVAFLAGFLMLLLIARLGIELLWGYLIVRLDGKAARNPHTLRYLQRDLLLFHRFIQSRDVNDGEPIISRAPCVTVKG